VTHELESHAEHEHEEPPASLWSDLAWLTVALGLLLPWLLMRGLSYDPGATKAVLFSGLSIVGAAFLLSWSAEMAQLEMSRSMATIVLALVAVLPEYAVDLYYGWGAGHAMRGWSFQGLAPSELGLPMANMTGSNRLLIGLGWSMVTLVGCWHRRVKALDLEDGVTLDLACLWVATAYAFVIVIKRWLGLVDCVVYLALFVVYVSKALRGPVEPPELEGPAARIATLPTGIRRVVNGLMFALAALAIYAAAQPFAEGLKVVGKDFGIETFLLVQWLAPLASESPEFLVAGMLAWRGAMTLGMGALISSKVNQWTLLVGMIPLAVCAAYGAPVALPLDDRQRQELLLTATQSAFALVLIGDLRLTAGEALFLGLTFLLQLFLHTAEQRLAFSAAYLIATVALLLTRSQTRSSLSRYLAAHFASGG
jgi:cation:H+ antiporter